MFCGTAAANTSPGPAPNSGDGVPDGSGFEPTTFAVELVIILLIFLIGLLLMFFLFKRRAHDALVSHKANLSQRRFYE